MLSLQLVWMACYAQDVRIAAAPVHAGSVAPGAQTRPWAVIKTPPSADIRHARSQIDKEWSAKAERPFDPYLTPLGEQQAKAVAAQLEKFDLKRVYVSPFLR